MFSLLLLKMDLNIEIPAAAGLSIDYITLQKMALIYNAINSGWSVRKREEKYIFTKKHEGQKEVYLDTYLQKFIESNLNLKNTQLNEKYNK